jgi:hypothetical protein
MMTTNQQPKPSRLLKWLIYMAITVGVLALVWSQLPRHPYSTDLSRIGQGQPALVLAYDIKSMGGMEVMAMMDNLRDQYANRVAFLVAPLGAPHGQAFGRQFGVDNGSVVLFSAQGQAVNTIHLPPNTPALQQALDDLLQQSPP